MTDQTIPPCPVCGNPQSKPNDDCMCCIADYFPDKTWAQMCEAELGRALRTHGIHTLAELESRLAPDPRVAVLDDVLLFTENAIRYAHLAYCRTLEREPEYLAEMKRIIAAQRGEVEK